MFAEFKFHTPQEMSRVLTTIYRKKNMKKLNHRKLSYPLAIMLCGLILPLFLNSCSSPYIAKITTGYSVPKQEEIAIMYADNADQNVSTLATQAIERSLTSCKKQITKAEQLEVAMQKSKIQVPRRMTADFIKSLRSVTKAKYLLTSGVTKWQEGAVVVFDEAKARTSVELGFTLWDIDNGEVVFTVSGGNSSFSMGLLAPKVGEYAEQITKEMFQQWSGFCE
jgi:hypothetical protein